MNETIEFTKMSRRRFFKRSAKKLLYSDWPCQILAFIIVGSCYIGINSFGANLSLLMYSLTGSKTIYGLLYSVYLVFSFFLMLPSVLGLVNFEVEALKNGKGNIKSVFCYFESANRLFECYRMSFSLIWRALLCFAPAIAIGIFLEFFYESGIFGRTVVFQEIDVVSFVIRSLFVVFIYVGFVLFARYVPAVFISIVKPNLSAKQVFISSKMCMFENTGEFVFMTFSFLPLCVVSLFSFGILFLMYTFPYMLITLVLYSKYLYEKELYFKNASEILCSEKQKF